MGVYQFENFVIIDFLESLLTPVRSFYQSQYWMDLGLTVQETRKHSDRWGFYTAPARQKTLVSILGDCYWSTRCGRGQPL